GGLVKTTAVSGDHQGAGFWAAGSGTARTLNLNGGVLEVNRFLKGGGNQALGIHFNGGTIRAAGNAAQFFTSGSGSMGGSAGFTSADFEVQAGGLLFDTNGYEVGIAPGLGGPGGLTKSGGGALYLNGANTYAGPTTVSAGTLGGTGSVAGAVNIAAGTTLSPGVSTGTFTAGSVALAGTYRCDIDDTLSDQLVVNGALDLTGATLDLRQAAPASRPVILLARYGSLTGQFASVTGLPSGYVLDYAYQGGNQIALVLPGGSRFGAWVTGYFPGVTDPQITGPDADPDHDGQPNALEFAFGGLPNQNGSTGAVQVIPGENGGAPTFTVAVPQGTPAFTGSPSPSATTQGYILTVGGSDDLLSDNVPVTPVPPLATGLPAAPSGYEYRSFRLAQPLPAPGKGFLRVSATPYTGEDLAVGDFDGPTFGDWISTGTAFSLGPATGSELAQLEITHADGGVASSEKQDDGPTGTLTSPVFRISRRYLAYRIGGGDYEHDACLNLLVDGQVVKSATGRTSDNLIEASWDLRKFAGKDAQIQIVDRAEGNWGHVNVGRMFQTDSPPVLPLQKGVLYHESLRPQLHFTAKQEIMDRLNPGERQEGWLNDLNGMIYYGGEYHLFAQRWNKCWIHAVSTDLLHWQELPPAFWEDPLDSGVQSGTCVVDYQNTSGL
ncbi:MAG: hypothetical protein JWO82_1331, partial [Akkermansiaceae bacterium]|nr:hypothetical protein [Akkermansiaceae bacterium]